MGKIVRKTLDEILKIPVSESEIAKIQIFDEKFDDPECPVLTTEQLTKASKTPVID